MKTGNPRAKLAIEIFCYRVRKYIGAYCAALGRVDGVIFTGGIGENSALVRAKSCERLDFFGITIDPSLNEKTLHSEGLVSSSQSKVKVCGHPHKRRAAYRAGYGKNGVRDPSSELIPGGSGMSRPCRTNTNARSIVTHLASSYPSPSPVPSADGTPSPQGRGLEVTVSIPLHWESGPGKLSQNLLRLFWSVIWCP